MICNILCLKPQSKTAKKSRLYNIIIIKSYPMSTYQSPPSRPVQPTILNKSSSPQIKPKGSSGSSQTSKNTQAIKQAVVTPLKHVSPPAKLPEKTNPSNSNNLNNINAQSPRSPTEKVGSLNIIMESPRKGTIIQPQSPTGQKKILPTKIEPLPRPRHMAPRMSEQPLRQIPSKSKLVPTQRVDSKKGLDELQINRIRSPTEPEKVVNELEFIRTRSPTSPNVKREPRMSEPVNYTVETESNEYDNTNGDAKEQSLINFSVQEDDKASTRYNRSPKPTEMLNTKKVGGNSESPVKPNEQPGAFMKKSPLTLTETVSTDSHSNNGIRYASPNHMSSSLKRTSPSLNTSKRNQPSVRIEDFALGRQLGSGKFGNVFVAKHRATGFLCALKIIPKDMVRQENIVNQLTRELRIQSCLDHPNIIKLYGFFDDEKNIYLMLELGSSGQLYKVLKDKGRLSEQTASYTVKQICEAIRYIHTFKIIHRDIKPENIVIQHGIAKMCDFGWAVNRGSELRSTFCGTPLYVSPEILKGEDYDQKIDLWSIGILTYELLVGDIPFQINREEELIKIIREDVVFPQNLGISEAAKDFVLKILQKNPNDRLKISQLLDHPFLNIKFSSDVSSDLDI